MPIIIPERYTSYKVIGIDPGLNNTGIAIFNIETIHNTIVSIEAFTIITDKLYNNTTLDEELYSERMVKLYKLKSNIIDIIKHFKPQTVVCESPFYNRFRPMAYGALLETISIIHSAIIEVDPYILFRTIEPLLIKKIIGAGSTKGKPDVKLAIQKTPLITNVLLNDIDTLDEHSLDSIAVAYSFLNNINFFK